MGEVAGITQRSEDTTPAATCKVDITNGSVLKAEAEAVVPEHLDADDVDKRVLPIGCFHVINVRAKGRSKLVLHCCERAASW